MEAIRNPDDYVIWLQGVFDSIGDRAPSEAEWKMIKERHALMAGEIVLQRVEKRQYEMDLERRIDEAKRNAALQSQKIAQQLGALYPPPTSAAGNFAKAAYGSLSNLGSFGSLAVSEGDEE